jgi:integrase
MDKVARGWHQSKKAMETAMATGTRTTLRLADDSKGKALPKRLNFAVEALGRLSCPVGKDRLYVFDTKVPGLAQVITATGARAFYLVRKIGGRKTRVRLGGSEITIEQARKLAAQLNGDIAGGNDPTALKRAARKSETLQELFDRYKREHLEPRCTHKTIITDVSRFNTCLADLTGRKVLSITETDVRALHLRLGREVGQTSANRAVQLLRRLFNWARLGVNPASKAVDMFRESSRDRFVQPDELPRLFAALDGEDINPLIRDYLYLALFTGARRANVAAMRMEQINMTSATWTIPAGSSKNHEPMAIPLPEPAMVIIKRRWGHPAGFIFPAASKSGHLEEPRFTWRKVLERAGLSDLRLHDLRRTYGSFQAGLGASLPVIGRSLGHRDSAATQIYSRLHLDPVRASVTAAVDAIVAAGGGVNRRC